MGQHQMLPPAAGGNPITVNGRSYSAPIGTVIIVPDMDGDILEANGWIKGAPAGAGITANRPAAPAKSIEFFDLTLNKLIRWDGKVWRDPTNGLAV